MRLVAAFSLPGFSLGGSDFVRRCGVGGSQQGHSRTLAAFSLPRFTLGGSDFVRLRGGPAARRVAAAVLQHACDRLPSSSVALPKAEGGGGVGADALDQVGLIEV
ncbi:hypothetical protein T484DRAFT_1827832 [Baffinella frigidus]|nr:hypothetical protein T484DRAFT_1827832 [Cryptophyta sp. CCMP2293]